MLRYLESFHERTQPLGSLEKVYAKLADFEVLWEAGQVPGWADRGQGTAGEDAASVIDVAAFASVEELETLGAAPVACSLIVLAIAASCSAEQAWTQGLLLAGLSPYRGFAHETILLVVTLLCTGRSVPGIPST